MNSLLAAVLDFAGEDLVEERVKDDIPKMNWRMEEKKGGDENKSESREAVRQISLLVVKVQLRPRVSVACVQIRVRPPVCRTCETDTVYQKVLTVDMLTVLTG